jgi:phosphoglycolate phosphatase-like HAD superfamily hydrolase
MKELFQKQLKRSPSDAEVEQMQNCFVRHLYLLHGSGTPAFMPVAGAANFLDHLSTNKEWVSVIATGGWIKSAQFKLQAANLFVSCPIVSSDDGLSREEIVSQAIESALHFYRVKGFSRIVSIGDGIWDVNTAKSLRLPFVGIARGTKADRLRSLGVSHLFPDFADLDAVVTALDEALEPMRKPGDRQVPEAIR